MRPVDAPPPDGRSRKWKWAQKMEHAKAHPYQWFEVVAVPKSTAQYLRDFHINKRHDFHCVTRNWRDGDRLCDVYLIFSPGKEPEL